MKKLLLIPALFTFCLSLFADEPTDQPNTPTTETEEVAPEPAPNFHVELKKGIMQALSPWTVDEFISLSDALFSTDYFDSIDEDKKEATLRRYYIFSAASAVLISLENDITDGSIEKLRLDLESTHSVTIDPITSLSLEQEDRLDKAYTLFLANLLAIIPPKELHKINKDQLNAVGFNSKHDKRALDACFKFVSFIALKNAELLVEDDKESTKLVNAASKKLHKGKFGIVQVANTINRIFM